MAFDNLIIRARSLSKSYGSEDVLTDFNIDIWYGSIFVILGVSGSGKTTALRLLAGFENPDQGTIEMHNKVCLLYTSPSPRDGLLSRMPSSA